MNRLLYSLVTAAILAAMLLIGPGDVVAQTSTEGVDVILIVDTSGSMRANDPEAIRVSAAKLFIDLSSRGDRVAVISMSGGEFTEVKTKLTRISAWLDDVQAERRALKENLDELAEPTKGGTFMGTALQLAYDILDKTEPGRRQFVVLLTDGVPEREDPSILPAVLEKFERKRYWKIFPVALGPGADFNFLQNEVAARTGGKAFKAATPEDLIRVYTEIFALIRENHYVNWIPFEMNKLQTIGTIKPQQQITDLALVVPKSDHKPFIDVLISPDGANIVDPAYAAGIYHAEDPRYEVYVIPHKSMPLVGKWQMRLEGDKPIEVAALMRSNLAMQLFSPIPRASWDELSERYHPLGERLFLQVGVRMSVTEVEGMEDILQPGDRLARYLSPMVYITGEKGPPLILRDDGLFSDLERNDGKYGGRYPGKPKQGVFILETEVPSYKPHPLRLIKSRAIEVLPLPRVRVHVPEVVTGTATIPVSVEFEDSEGSGATIASAEVTVWIKEPDGKAYSMPAAPQEKGYGTQINVSKPGTHSVAALARVIARRAGEELPYESFDQANVTVMLPEVSIRALETDLGAIEELADTQVRVEVTSRSTVEETLSVSIEGLPDAAVTPNSIAVPPNQTTEFVFSIGTTRLAEPGPGRFSLVFESPSRSAHLLQDRAEFTYEIVQAISLQAEETDLGKIKLKDLRVRVTARSDSTQEETLAVRVEGLGPEATVFPDSIRVPPKEETTYTFDIDNAEAEPTEAGEFDLVFEPMEGAAKVAGGRITFKYSLPEEGGGGGTLVTVLLLLVVVGIAAFLIIRRRQQRMLRRRRRR